MDTGVLVIVLESALLVGLVPAFVARAKGRSFLLWWLYGAAAIVIALPHILLAGSDGKSARDADSPSAATPSHCPSCNEPVRPYAVACRHCGYSFVGEMDWSRQRGATATNDIDEPAPSPHAAPRDDERTTARETAPHERARMTGTAAGANLGDPLPWSESDFARISEHGPKTTAAPDRHPARTATARWPHRRLAFIAVSATLVVWLAILGFAALTPSPKNGPTQLASGAAAPPAGGAPTGNPARAAPREAAAPSPTSSPALDTRSSLPAAKHVDGGDPRSLAASLPVSPQNSPFVTLPSEQTGDAATPAPGSAPTQSAPTRSETTASREIGSKRTTPQPAASDRSTNHAADTSHARRAPDRRDTARTADHDAAATARANRTRKDDAGGVTAIGELVFWMQRRLADLGYYNGRINGRAGPDTRRAIRSYQRAAHLTPTGRINDALIVSLRRARTEPVASRGAR